MTRCRLSLWLLNLYVGCIIQYVSNFENSAVAIVQEKVSFQPIQKKDNFKECSTYHAIVLISLASKVTRKILQAKRQQYMKRELPNVQTGLRNQRSNCQHPLDHRDSKGIPEKQFSLLRWHAKAFHFVDHSKLWKILKEMGVSPYLSPENSACRSKSVS